MVHRAYSLLTLKAVDEEKRILHGIATTPSPDRLDDIVEPKGAEFKLPIPVLWHHHSAEPIGHVTKAKVTADGIEVQVQLAKVDEPGTLKSRLDEAWQSIKAGLVRGLSIGFKGKEVSRLENGGLRFIKWLWLELSAVTIPANSEATITTIKSLDSALLAATGQKRSGVVHLSPGASGISKTRIAPKEGGTMKTISEQIAQWEAKRKSKADKAESIMTKAAEEDRTLDAAEKEEHTTLTDEVKEIDEHLERLADMEKTMKTKLRPAEGGDPDAASRSRDPAAPRIQVLDPKVAKGDGFVRYAVCLFQAKNDLALAAEIAKARYPGYEPLQRIFKGVALGGGPSIAMMQKSVENMEFLKAAVGAGTTTDNNFASALVELTLLGSEFLEYLRPDTIIGKFGTNGVPSMRNVPFNVKVPRQVTKGAAKWTGEGKGKGVTRWNLDQVELTRHTITAISVITKQLARFSNPKAEGIVRDELKAAVIERMDVDFVDPDKAVSGTTSPASITNGVGTAASSGDDIDNVKTDLLTIYAEFNQANINRSNLVYITNQNIADALALMTYDLGNPAFPGVAEGRFFNRPLIASQWVKEGLFIAMDAQSVLFADDGVVSIDASEEASLQMDDTPSQASDTPTASQVVSMWQTNSIAFRAEREITWMRGRDEGVFYLTSVNWGGTAGSGDI